MAQLKLEILREEGKQASGTGHLPKVSASALFRKAVDIEGQLLVFLLILFPLLSLMFYLDEYSLRK